MADFGVTEYLALAGAASAAAGAGVAAYSARQQGIAQSQAMQYQAQVAKNNQVIAEQYAVAAQKKGELLEGQKRAQVAQQEGQIRAAAGASNLEVNSGSPLRLQTDTARLGELDALTIRNNAEREAYGYKVQGVSYGAQAQLDEMGAESASRSGALGMWSSIIGGASSTADKWLSYKQKGVF